MVMACASLLVVMTCVLAVTCDERAELENDTTWLLQAQGQTVRPQSALPPCGAFAETSKSSPGDCVEIVAVVSNFKHKADVDWLKEAPPTLKMVQVGVDSEAGHDIAESIPWLEWITENLHQLPPHVALLHGDQRSWHSTLDVERLLSSKPKDVQMLAQICWSNSQMHSGKLAEPYFVENLYQSLWNMSWHNAWEQWDMARRYHCCSESVVSREALQRIHPKVYQSLLETMKAQPSVPWGFVMEHAWQNFFSKKFAFDTDTVVAKLKRMQSMDFSLLQSDASSVHERSSHAERTAKCIVQ